MSMIVMMNMCLIYKSPLILYFFIVFLKRAFPFRKCTIFSQGFFPYSLYYTNRKVLYKHFSLDQIPQRKFLQKQVMERHLRQNVNPNFYF